MWKPQTNTCLFHPTLATMVLSMTVAVMSGCGGEKTEPSSGCDFETTAMWHALIEDGVGLTVGDWDGEPGDEILAATDNGRLYVFTLDGTLIDDLDLSAAIDPDDPTWWSGFSKLSLGQTNDGPQLSAHGGWSLMVNVFDADGGLSWNTYNDYGINDTTWGDLDGDGLDELLLAYNGSGGAHARSSEGELIWNTNEPDADYSSRRTGNVWDVQVVPPRPDREAIVVLAAHDNIEVRNTNGDPMTPSRLEHDAFGGLAVAPTSDGGVEIASIGLWDDTLIVTDQAGTEQWQVPAFLPLLSPANAVVTADVDADSISEWAYYDPTGKLVVMSSTGEQRAVVAMPFSEGSYPFCDDDIVTPDGHAIAHDEDDAVVVVLLGDRLVAFPIE